MHTSDETLHARDRRPSWAAHNWGWVLGFGIAAIVFGIALVGSAFAGLALLAWLAGLFLVFMGVAELVMPLRAGGRSSQLIGAAIAIVGGLVLLVWPGETLTVLAFVVGIAFTAWGLASIVMALRHRRENGRWDIIVGVGSAALGILMMAWPTQTVALVGVLVGLVAVVWGVVTALNALDLRRTGRRWEEARRPERERIERTWEEFERSEETREAGAVRPSEEAEPSGAVEPPRRERAA
jgi:uncharacterized membrane protein HdeD (DUF308 family)